MRNTAELLQILLDNINLCGTGLCGMSCTLYYSGIISDIEYHNIREYIKSNMPDDIDDWRKQLTYWYYWAEGDIEPRIKYLKHHIELLNNKTKSNEHTDSTVSNPI